MVIAESDDLVEVFGVDGTRIQIFKVIGKRFETDRGRINPSGKLHRTSAFTSSASTARN